MRNRAWRRHQRARIILKRLNIAKSFYWYKTEGWPWIKNGSRLAKYNFTCDSRMCKLNGFYSRQEKRHREDVKHPLVEYDDLSTSPEQNYNGPSTPY